MGTGALCPSCGEPLYGGDAVHPDCYALADSDRHRELAPCVCCRVWHWRDEMNERQLCGKCVGE